MASRRAMQAELEQICKANNGVLRPQDVVDYASDPAAALHEWFTWDDGTAAQQFRLWQARKAITMCVTVRASDAKPYQMYVSLERDRNKGGGYRPLVKVLANKAQRAELLAEACRDMQVFADKYSKLTELAGVLDAMKNARKRARQK